MNYYYNFPFMMPHTNPGLFSNFGLFGSLFRGGINWSSLLSGTQKTLNVINQIIPIVKQIPPIYRNAKTMFRVMNEFQKIDNTPSKTNDVNVSPTSPTPSTNYQKKVNQNYSNGPTFFL